MSILGVLFILYPAILVLITLICAIFYSWRREVFSYAFHIGTYGLACVALLYSAWELPFIRYILQFLGIRIDFLFSFLCISIVSLSIAVVLRYKELSKILPFRFPQNFESFIKIIILCSLSVSSSVHLYYFLRHKTPYAFVVTFVWAVALWTALRILTYKTIYVEYDVRISFSKIRTYIIQFGEVLFTCVLLWNILRVFGLYFYRSIFIFPLYTSILIVLSTGIWILFTYHFWKKKQHHLLYASYLRKKFHTLIADHSTKTFGVSVLLIYVLWVSSSVVQKVLTWQGNIPMLYSVTPASGIVGSKITLRGENFGGTGIHGPGMVYIGASPLVVHSWTNTTIETEIPVPPPVGDIYIETSFEWQGKRMYQHSNKKIFRIYTLDALPESEQKQYLRDIKQGINEESQ